MRFPVAHFLDGTDDDDIANQYHINGVIASHTHTVYVYIYIYVH